MSNEITVKLNCSIAEICKILENKDFKIVEKYLLDDTYFIPENLDLKNLTEREILSKAILLRDISEYMPIEKICKLTYKRKQIDENGIILKQEKIDCEVVNFEDGKRFIEAIGYKELMNIKENNVVYEKDDLKIAIKEIKNGDNLIEVETVDNNKKLDTIDKIIHTIEKLEIPICTDDYFIKKAEIELKKIL